MKLVDALMYHGERHALTIRLNEIDADHVIIAEGDRTFQGTPWPPTFNPADFPEHADRIEHVIVRLPEDAAPFDREAVLRNGLGYAASLHKGARVFLSDADEIAPGAFLKDIIPSDPLGLPSRQHFYWTLDWELVGGIYGTQPIYCTAETLLWQGAQDLRWGNGLAGSHSVGWHYSFLGDVDFAADKYRSFAHDELAELAQDKLAIAERIRTGQDASPDRGIKLQPAEIDSTSPSWVRDNLGWVMKNRLSRHCWE